MPGRIRTPVDRRPGRHRPTGRRALTWGLPVGVLGAVALAAVLGLAASSPGSSLEAAPSAPVPATPSSTATVTPPTTPTTSASAPTASSDADAGAAGGATTGAPDRVPAPAGAAPRGAATAQVPAGLRPAVLSIAAIGLRTELGELGVQGDGSVEVPSDPAQAGWFDRGPAPGQQGPAVVLGHVDSLTGPAVFAQLGRLKEGDPIVVTRRDGTAVTFTVDAVQTVPKDDFPTAQTYGPVPGPALRLITCGGSYDHSRGGYQANVIVFAS